MTPAFGPALQRLRHGDAAKRLPPVKNLKVVMAVDDAELTLLDAMLAHTEEAMQGLFRAAVMAGSLSPQSELARDVPSFLVPQATPRERQPDRRPGHDGRPGNDGQLAKRSETPPQRAPRPPPLPLPKTAEECNAIPDAVAARLRRGPPLSVGGFYRIDRMYLFGSEAILAACAQDKFDQAVVLAGEILNRQRRVAGLEGFHQQSVKISRELSGTTVPVPKAQDECRKAWGRILSVMPLDDIDGEERFGHIRTLCERRAYAKAHEEMSKYIDLEVRGEIERLQSRGPRSP